MRLDSLGGKQWILIPTDEGPDQSVYGGRAVRFRGATLNLKDRQSPTVLSREITRLIYPTQGPSDISGVLILQF